MRSMIVGRDDCSDSEEEDPRQDDDGFDGLLVPYETRQKLAQAFSPSRIALALALLALALVAALALDAEKFNVWIRVPNVAGVEGCRHVCQEFKKSGKGWCKDMKFSVCSLDKAGEEDDCIQSVDGSAPVSAPSTWQDTKFPIRKCQLQVVRPMKDALITGVIFTFVIALVIQGLPPEVMLLGGACVLCLLGAIDRNTVFRGLSDGSLSQLAVLFPISEAMQETGVLEQVIGMSLGRPSSLTAALPRMMGLVALLSAFLSNTATVALMIPILVTWAKRLDVHPGKLLMPLSFAAQLGGSMTLVGSSHCFVAASAVSKQYTMKMMDLLPVGAALLASTSAVVVALSGTSLLASSAEGAVAGRAEGAGDQEDAAAPADVYQVNFVVNEHGDLAGQTIEDSGLTRITGVDKVHRVGSIGSVAHGLMPEEELSVFCTAEGVVALRTQPGLRLANSRDLAALGARRRRRFLYEVSVSHDSEFISTDILRRPKDLRKAMGACLIAGPRASLAADCVPRVSAGSVLLIEAYEAWIEEKAATRWSRACALIRKIPKSSPRRVGGPVDSARGAVVVAGMVLLIALSSVKATGVRLDTGGAIFCLVLLGIRALSFAELFGSMKVGILFTIAGALAMGDALQQTGIVNYAADRLMSFAAQLGNVGVVGMVYALAVFLSMFINNSATVAILGPMIMKMSSADLRIESLTWTLVYGAGSCFTTPLGYQTNLMVMPDGKYTFGDFARFGSLVQLAHMVFCVIFIMLLG